MPEKTEAQKKAQKKYMEKFTVAQVRMEREKYERVQAHAETQGESVNAYINGAIDRRMAQEAAGVAGDIHLLPETIKAAQEAAEAAGEAIPVFMSRAVEAQAQRDKSSLAMGINPSTGGKLEKEA